MYSYCGAMAAAVQVAALGLLLQYLLQCFECVREAQMVKLKILLHKYKHTFVLNTTMFVLCMYTHLMYYREVEVIGLD